MRSILLVETDVLAHQAFQMPLIHDDDMVEQIPAAVSHPAFGRTALPRASETGLFRLNAEDLYRADDFIIEVCASIENQVFRSGVKRKCFTQLLYDSGTLRMPGHSAANDAPPVKRDDEEVIENAE